MKRRDFLKRAVPAATLPFMLGGYTLKAYGRSPVLDSLLASSVDTDRVLVLIQLNGGNDGLNTVIPLDQYGLYQSARSNIAIQEEEVLKLTDATGLHPQMGGIQKLYGQEKIRVVQSVGYAVPDYSHFRSTDIWLTGSEYDQILTTGWMGRYLDHEFPGYPTGYPNSMMPDPLAIQIGSSLSTGLEGPAANMGMSFSNPTSFYNIVNGTGDPVPDNRAGFELDFIRGIGRQLDKFAAPVKAAATKVTNKSGLYPALKQNSLADQLRIVATLIAGGLKTRIYIVNLGGFDTHAAQTTNGNPHGTLLSQVSVGIDAFQDDLRLLGVEERVVGMTFSEFGRRIKSNSSGGTDHGAAAPLFVFGTNVIPGILGSNPTIPQSVTPGDNVPMLYDFRSVYASILQDWFGASQEVLRGVLYKDFEILPIIKTAPSSVGNGQTISGGVTLQQNVPNPFLSSTRIRFTSGGEHLRLSIFNAAGKEISTLVDRAVERGEHEVIFEAGNLPSGTYYCRLQSGREHQLQMMMLAR